MKLHLTILSLICASALCANAQNVWRGRHKLSAAQTKTVGTAMELADSGLVTASGFEKTLRGTIESFFLTNRSSDTIRRVSIHAEYFDAADRQLHSRDENIGVDLPPGETRRVEMRSFDRQGTFYYHLSTPPRTRANATPFKVRLRVDSITRNQQNTTE